MGHFSGQFCPSHMAKSPPRFLVFLSVALSYRPQCRELSEHTGNLLYVTLLNSGSLGSYVLLSLHQLACHLLLCMFVSSTAISLRTVTESDLPSLSPAFSTISGALQMLIDMSEWANYYRTRSSFTTISIYSWEHVKDSAISLKILQLTTIQLLANSGTLEKTVRINPSACRTALSWVLPQTSQIGISDSWSRVLDLPFKNWQDYSNIHTVWALPRKSFAARKQFSGYSLTWRKLLEADSPYPGGSGGLLSKMECEMQMQPSSRGSASLDLVGNQGL